MAKQDIAKKAAKPAKVVKPAGRVLRLGVIGQGRSGRNIHTEFLKNVPEKFKIVAVSDLLADRCERAATEYGCATYQDYREMINDKSLNLDLVVNSSFSHMHAPISKEIMLAGLNVLSEKPFARTSDEVKELIGVSKQTGLLLAVFQQSRFAPYYRKINEILLSGVLGRIKMVKIAFNNFARRYDWQTLQAFNAGGLFNTGPHPMDQALGFIGRDIMPNVWCKMDVVNSLGDADDFCKVMLSYPGRPIIDLEVCSNSHFNPYVYQVYGTYGSLTGTMNRIEWKYYKPEEAPPVKLIREPLPGPSYCSDKLEFQSEAWEVPAEEKDLFNSTSARFYDNLYDALTKGTALVITPEQVGQQIAVIEECHRQNPLPRKF